MNKYIKQTINLIVFISVLLSMSLHASNTNNLTLSQLLALFSQSKQSTVDFIEEKHAFFLEQPMTSSGYVEFISPNKLNKFITKPEVTSQKISDNELEIISGEQKHIIDLNEHPEFSVILQSIISLLAGDHVTLQKTFKLKFNNSHMGWQLHLTPKDSYILGYVNSIQMFGSENKLTKLIITEANNDHTTTYFSNHR